MPRTTPDTTDPSEASALGKRLWRWTRHRAGYVIPIATYVLLVLFGVTLSNIGISSLREDPAAPLGIQIGSSQGIRSDEWGTESPLWLGEIARGGAQQVAPLSVSNDFFAQLPDGPASSIVFFDGTLLALGPWVPDQMLFAAKWWLPTLLLFLALPVWFRQVGGSRRWGYLAAFLIFAAPGTAWWSGRPINTLGFVAAGCALAIYGVQSLAQRRWWRGAAAIIVSGILLARLPTYYQPLAIVIGIPLILATAAVLLTRSAPWRERLWTLAAVGGSSILWTGLLFWENRAAFIAGLSTLYPGDRVSTGGATTPGMVFGATNLGVLEKIGTAFPSNQSEISTSFTVLLVVLVVLVAARRWSGGRALAAALIPIAALGLFWLSWGTVSWGSWGAMIPLANRVPNTRAMLGVGYLAILAFCLFMSQWRAVQRRAVPVLAGATAAFLSAYGGSSLQTTAMPDLGDLYIWACALATGVVVYALVAFSTKRWPLLLAAVAAAALTITAQPVLFGLGDLRASSTAQKFMAWGSESMADGTLWASTSQDVDSLMTATGTPALSGRQQIGPDSSEWLKLDPGGAHEEMWNRGGLHVTYAWTDDDDVTFEQPYPDTIVISTSPCELARRIDSFAHAISPTPLQGDCLAEADTFMWGGIEYRVYDVAR